VELDPSQQAAVDLMLASPFCVVTGGPGVGKTTTLRAALDRMDIVGERYRLAAPTGKAAKRMSEATGREACTIHRLLEWYRGKFLRNEQSPIESDVVVVDESSMLDVELAASLVRACRADTRVIFIGDANQLPSVGPGRVLGDLVESNAVPVARLTTVHRAAAESWICRNAPRVLSGDKLELGDKQDFRFVECESAEDAARYAAGLVADVGQPWAGAQILTPQRNLACGVDALNAALQQRLNPPADGKNEWKSGDRVLRLGDRVIQTKNNYELEVFNGEVGDVCAFPEGAFMTVDFGDRKVAYTREHAFALELAYALTIHKSQGSEFPWVVCVVHSSHTYMLTRNLFYTGITRAKKGVIIVGNRKGLHAATAAKDPPKRNTGLVDRMRELAGGPAVASSEPEAPPAATGRPPARQKHADMQAAVAPQDDIAW